MLKLLAEIMKIINSETDPRQISLSVCFAMIVGLTPLFCLHNLLIFFLVFSLRVNLATFFLAWPLFSGVAYLLDPLAHQVGLAVLQLPALNGLWTTLYSNAVFKLEKFYNSIVMGSLIFSAILFMPCFLFTNFMIRKYRENILAWVEKTRLMKILKASRIYAIYQTVAGQGGAS